jgi:hypothetical protein
VRRILKFGCIYLLKLFQPLESSFNDATRYFFREESNIYFNAGSPSGPVPEMVIGEVVVIQPSPPSSRLAEGVEHKKRRRKRGKKGKKDRKKSKKDRSPSRARPPPPEISPAEHATADNIAEATSDVLPTSSPCPSTLQSQLGKYACLI